MYKFTFIIIFLHYLAMPNHVISVPLHMSIQEKVGQLLMVSFEGEVINEDARVLIQDVGVGGVIYYTWSNGLTSQEQVKQLSDGLQSLTRSNKHPLPLFIAIDQEGGIVNRLQKECTLFPGNAALGAVTDPQLVEEVSFAMGQELQAVGVNMNFAPVVDVNVNPNNPVIGLRSFGADPEVVAQLGKSAVEGYKRAHVIATLKHFPGHGDVEVDSHEELPIIYKSMQELESVELLPFARLSPSVEAVMTAHLLVPAVDKENCSTLSKKTVHYLRNTIGFQGVLISDSLTMQGVLKKCDTIDEAAIRALQAGCDILLLGGRVLVDGDKTAGLTAASIQRIHRALVKAVQDGRVPEERVNEAVERILDLKLRTLSSNVAEEARPCDLQKHALLAEKVAMRAIKKQGELPYNPLMLHQKNIVLVAPQTLQACVESTQLLRLGKSVEPLFFTSLNPTQEEGKKIISRAQLSDIVIMCSYNSWKNPEQIALIEALIESGKPFVLVVTRDPLDAKLFSRASVVFTTYSPTAVSLQAVCNQLR